jgi:hypothetical protein
VATGFHVESISSKNEFNAGPYGLAGQGSSLLHQSLKESVSHSLSLFHAQKPGPPKPL